ncbi:hypothetical protein QBC46DRAFT_233899, partial [Diplogelasinospora grovesii]
RSKLSTHDRRHPVIGRLMSLTLINYKIRALRGLITVFNTMLKEVKKLKAPISIEDRIVELIIKNGRLRQEINYYKILTEEALHPIITLIKLYTHELYLTI